MKIKKVNKYVFKGVEYSSLKDVKEKIHDTIGLEVLDKISRVCPLEKHKDYFKLLDLLCSKEVREVLVDCFTVTYEEPINNYDDDYFNDDFKTLNILDLK